MRHGNIQDDVVASRRLQAILVNTAKIGLINGRYKNKNRTSH